MAMGDRNDEGKQSGETTPLIGVNHMCVEPKTNDLWLSHVREFIFAFAKQILLWNTQEIRILSFGFCGAFLQRELELKLERKRVDNRCT